MRTTSLLSLLSLTLVACGSRVDFNDKGGDTGAPDEADADTDTDTDTDSDTDADTDSDTDADTDSDTDADTDSVWDSATGATLEGIGGPALVTLVDYSVRGDTVVGNGRDGFVWISTDGGRSWTSSYNENFLYTVGGVAVTDEGIFVSSYRGIFKTVDGGETWTTETTGLDGAFATELATDGTALYATTGYGEQYFRWEGGAWTEVTAPGKYTTLPVVSGDTLYAADFGMNVYKSEDGGETWELTAAGGAVDTLIPSAFAEGDLLGTNYSRGTLRRSTDGGYTWTDVSIPSGAEGFVVHDGVIYARMYMSGVMKSVDDGESWTNASAGLPSGWGLWVQDFAVTSDGSLIASPYQSGPYRFDGTSWTPSAEGMTGGSATGATFHDGRLLSVFGNDYPWSYDAAGGGWTSLESPAAATAMLYRIASNDSTILVTSGYDGLYRSTNDGASWAGGSNGLPTTIYGYLTVWDLAMDGDTVLAAHTIDYEGTSQSEYTPTGGGASVSFDAGRTWSYETRGLPVVDTDFRGWSVYPSATAAHAGDDVFVLATIGNGIFRSIDEGGIWEETSGVTGATMINDLAEVGGALYAGGQDVNAPTADGGNGLWRSDDDGATWVSDVTGLPETPLVAALATTGTSVFALVTAPTQGIWRRDAGTWTLVAEAGEDYILTAPLALEGDAFYVGTQGAGIVRLVPVE